MVGLLKSEKGVPPSRFILSHLSHSRSVSFGHSSVTEEHIDVVCLILLATFGAVVTEVIDYEAQLEGIPLADLAIYRRLEMLAKISFEGLYWPFGWGLVSTRPSCVDHNLGLAEVQLLIGTRDLHSLQLY